MLSLKKYKESSEPFTCCHAFSLSLSLSPPQLSYFISFFIFFSLPFPSSFLSCLPTRLLPSCLSTPTPCLLPFPIVVPLFLSERGSRLSWILIGIWSRDDRECLYNFDPSNEFLQRSELFYPWKQGFISNFFIF